MSRIRVYSAAEQVANYLREELAQGTWTGKMPGGAALCRQLGVGRMTADAALEILEAEGILASQGAGRNRAIRSTRLRTGRVKVGVLPFLTSDYRLDYVMEMEQSLLADGHTVIHARKSIAECNSCVSKVAQLVGEAKADAWIVIAGPKEVLAWFCKKKTPTFALFGRRHEVPLAGIGPDKETAYRLLVRHLVGLGHRRICLFTRPLRRLPVPGLVERAFLDELERFGIPTSSYHLPDWDGKIESLAELLQAMWRYTPPTAMVVDEPPLFFSVQQHLARVGVLAPENVSLVCTDGDPYFDLQRPSIAHIRWDSRPWVRRVVRWVEAVSHGKTDVRQTLTKAEFVQGHSIGPNPCS